MTQVSAIWDAIRADSPAGVGLHVRLLDPTSPIRLLAAIVMPSDSPALVLEVPSAAVSPGTTYPKCAGFSVRPELVSGGTVRLRLERAGEQYADLFEILCQDVADQAKTAPSEAVAFRAILGRLATWQRFVQEHGLNRMTEEKQIGLFAELVYFGQHVLPRMAAADAFRCWRGPSGEAHDFELHDVSVEIKATSKASPSFIGISNLDQLELTGDKPLILTTMQITEDNHTGQTLSDIVDSTRRMIAEVDESATIAFDAILMQVGYLRSHSDSYGIRRRCSHRRDFRVGDGFPRMTRSTVPPGISEASYRIRIDSCLPFEIEQETVNASMEGTCA